MNLHEIEAFLGQAGHTAACVGDAQRLTVFAEGTADPRTIRMLIGAGHRIPPSRISVLEIPVLPRDAAGAIDYAALKARKTAVWRPRRPKQPGLRESMAIALSRKAIADTDTFASLGGDSLAFLEMYLALERQLGHVPPGWETKPILELESLQRREESTMQVPFHLLVRLLAVAEVVALHAHTWAVGGGVYVLLALAGYSMSQFQQANILTGRVVRVVGTLFPRLLVAYFAIVLAYCAYRGVFDPLWLLLLGNFSHEEGTFIEPLWFIPAYLQVIVLFLAVAAIPAVRRKLNATPWQAGMTMLAGALALRAVVEILSTDPITLMRSPFSIVHLLVLGWCMQHADNAYRKAGLTVVATAIAFAFWNASVAQSVFIAACCAAVLWIGNVPLPRRIGHVVTMVGSASFFIYVFHMLPVHVFEVAIPLADYTGRIPALAVILSLSVLLGLFVHALTSRVVGVVRARLEKRAAASASPLAPEW